MFPVIDEFNGYETDPNREMDHENVVEHLQGRVL